MGASRANPPVSGLLKGVTGIEALVLLGAGGGLLIQPAVIAEIWPWPLTPFNAGFLGAIYTASMVTAALLVLAGRWSPARVAVPMILLFTAIVLAVSAAYLDRFQGNRAAVWLWFLLYVAIPANAAYHLWRYRNLPPAGRTQLDPPLRGFLFAASAALGLYGLALLAAPETLTAFWPWRIDPFHGRLYSVVFLTPALGLLLLTRSAAWAEVLTLAATLIAGALTIVALIAVDLRVQRVNWAAAGTWLWIAMFAAIALTGALLLPALGKLPRPGRLPDEAALAVPPHGAALVFGAAFVAAGIGGFIPAFTHPAPAGAPPLIVPAAYGYLLGLYPVNAIHSLFHLTIGVLGLAAFARPAWALGYLRGFAVVLAALTVMGLLPQLNIMFGLAPLFGHDIWLHGIEAVAAAYIGFVMPDARAAPQNAARGAD